MHAPPPRPLRRRRPFRPRSLRPAKRWRAPARSAESDSRGITLPRGPAPLPPAGRTSPGCDGDGTGVALTSGISDLAVHAEMLTTRRRNGNVTDGLSEMGLLG